MTELTKKKSNYKKLSKELVERIQEDRRKHTANPYAFPDEKIVRRKQDWDRANLWRPAFVRDIEKIMHVPYYNRYADKTQVFSFRKNDDISRRSFHVQLVSRIARNIGSVLNLNNDLIEAIALGHDIGHTPFGHEGERQLNALFYAGSGRYFNHNVQSVRVLDRIIHRNISLQTLDGILCHNGEMEQQEFKPQPLGNFAEFDRKTDDCIQDQNNIAKLVPCTLEGCVVRISDIIAYIGKDRQDAQKLGIIQSEGIFTGLDIGSNNAELINNLIVNIIEKSYGNPYLSMDKDCFDMLVQAKRENAEIIYKNSDINNQYQKDVKPMMEKMYRKFVQDAGQRDKNSLLYRHHVDFVNGCNQKYADPDEDYANTEANQMAADFIASMTDDYFVEAYEYLFPGDKHSIHYVGYFES